MIRDNGAAWTLAAVAGLAVAGATRRRGSRADRPVPVIYGSDRTRADRMVLPDGTVIPAVRRRSIRGRDQLTPAPLKDPQGFPITAAELEHFFGEYNSVQHERLEELADALNGAYRTREVNAALDLANEILGGHGIEFIKNDEDDHSWDAAGASYVNAGDTYAATIMHDGHDFFISDWGTYVENTRAQRQAEEQDELW